ncbi:MAG: hypothetical protein A2749_01575 [Parcubacteria group bacterium RIFCSPHIGHO2_01_FULL_45_26]|nr:MAG: hypothetical protein A2749_01575 [Parcubacteria group bacterium RIFCSPHIGHO2_01_FULL_45_26]
MPINQEIDPFHNIPRSQIVTRKIAGVNQTKMLALSLGLLILAGFFFWGEWIEKVVPDKYVFDVTSHVPDRDYLPPSLR